MIEESPVQRDQLKGILENILLASDQPVTVTHLLDTFQNTVPKEELQESLEELQSDYDERNLQIIMVAGGYQLCTRGEYSEWLKKFLKLDKTSKLSQPALDTLSIIAYKQPLTRAEVDEIRGVDSGGVIKTLLEKKVITPAGRKKVPGRPVMYRTTRKFLEYFGLKDLSDLPTLDDLNLGELEGDGVEHTQGSLPFAEEEAVESRPDEIVENEISTINEAMVETGSTEGIIYPEDESPPEMMETEDTEDIEESRKTEEPEMPEEIEEAENADPLNPEN